MHVRGQIREAFRLDLAALGIAAQRIFFDSDEVPQEPELPVFVCTIGDEDIQHETLGGSTGAILGRSPVVNVDIIHAARTDALLEAEEFAAQIETAIATSTRLPSLLRSWFPQALNVSRNNEGAQTTVQLRLQWLVTYSTNERDPTVAIP
jgi:hypothetical protein